MTKQELGKYGEPWTFKLDPSNRGNQSASTSWVSSKRSGKPVYSPGPYALVGGEHRLERAVACVNAMQGLDPQSVRALLNAMARTAKYSEEQVGVAPPYDKGVMLAEKHWCDQVRECFGGDK